MQSTRNDEPAGLTSKNAAIVEYPESAPPPYPPAQRFPAVDYTAYPSEDVKITRQIDDQITQIDYPRKLITPAGYHLGPNGEGWQSERSSLYRYQPTFSSPSPRRENPKSNGLAPCLKVPMPKTKPDYDIVVEYQGLKLGRISDAVPYLLGPRNIQDRIQVILEHDLQFAEPVYTASSTSSDTPSPYKPKDRALIAILTSLRTTEYARRERGNWYPQGLATKHDALRLYKHNARNGVKPVHLTLADFLDKASAWQRVPRPSCTGSGDEVSVDVEKVDGELYSQLTTEIPSEAPAQKINEVVACSGDGMLERRYNRFYHSPSPSSSSSAPPATRKLTTSPVSSLSGTPHPHPPPPSTEPAPTTTLYSKRFTHTHPLGRPRSAVSDVEKTEQPTQHDNATTITTTTTTTTILAQQQQQQKQQPSRPEASELKPKWWIRSKKKRNRIFFIAFMVAVFGAILGAMLWSMGTSRWDFTAGGEMG